MVAKKKERPQASLLDSIAVGLSPALIIGMISCLIFFLITAFYRGQYDLRLMYIFGLYTMATVLIARIAIENGRMYAMAFAIPLAGAAMLAMLRFVVVTGPAAPFSLVINIGLLAFSWWLADRITFDCTLLEEDRESVQNGLLQSLGLMNRAEREEGGEGGAVQRQDHRAKAVRDLKKAKHNPGVWVLYYALLAIPMFGLGQLLIPDERGRNTAFWFLVGYLAFAMALLLTTSLLSMRRYLRQRGLSMPIEVTQMWLSIGTCLVAGILIACLILPMPGRSMGLVGLPFEFKSPEGLMPSKWGWGNDGPQDGKGGQSQQKNKDQGEQDSQSEQPSEQSGKMQQGGGQKQNQQSGGEKQQEGKSSQQNDQNRSSSDDSKGQQNKEPGSQQSKDANQQSQSNSKKDGGKRQSEERDPNRQTPSKDRNDRQDEADPSQRDDQDQQQQQQKQRNESRDQGNNQEQRQDQEQNREQPEKSDQSESESQAARPPESTPMKQMFDKLGGDFSSLFKWLTIIILAGIVVVYAITHPRELARLWRGFFDWLSGLFGRKPNESLQTDETSAAGQTKVARKPFSSYADPFSQNLQGWEARRVVEHTFAALEAWAAEHGCERDRQQTADEFAKRLSQAAPRLAKFPQTAADFMDRVMFAQWNPSHRELAPLAELWRLLRTQ
ncbi:MAG: hypothetical protein U0892_05025 [Pirellulales bacterium]